MKKKKRAQSMDSDVGTKRGKKKGGPSTDESIIEHPKLPEIVKLLSQIYRILVGLETDKIPKKKTAGQDGEDDEEGKDAGPKKKTQVLNDLSESVRHDRITE